jgi:hypothetical protein
VTRFRLGDGVDGALGWSVSARSRPDERRGRIVRKGSPGTVSVRTNRTRTMQRFHVAGRVSAIVGTRRRVWVTASHPDGVSTTTLIDLDGAGPQS